MPERKIKTELFDSSDKERLDQILETVKNELQYVKLVSLENKVEFINNLRAAIHEVSPFKDEPVDFVRWIENPLVHQNDYNPNSVAPPEMELNHDAAASTNCLMASASVRPERTSM